eukprot:3860440-Pleurochrysis_carterae.AAC.2
MDGHAAVETAATAVTSAVTTASTVATVTIVASAAIRTVSASVITKPFADCNSVKRAQDAAEDVRFPAEIAAQAESQLGAVELAVAYARRAQLLDEREKVAHADKVATALRGVDSVGAGHGSCGGGGSGVVVVGGGVGVGLIPNVVGYVAALRLCSDNRLRSKLDVDCRRLCALDDDGPVHLGRVECPIREPDEGDWRVHEERVEQFERHLGRQLGEAHFVEQQASRSLVRVLLVATRHVCERMERRGLGQSSKLESGERAQICQISQSHVREFLQARCSSLVPTSSVMRTPASSTVHALGVLSRVCADFVHLACAEEGDCSRKRLSQLVEDRFRPQRASYLERQQLTLCVLIDNLGRTIPVRERTELPLNGARGGERRALVLHHVHGREGAKEGAR